MDNFNNNVQKLREYKKLFDEGIIDKDQYEELKQKEVEMLQAPQINYSSQSNTGKFRSISREEYNQLQSINNNFFTSSGRFSRTNFLAGFLLGLVIIVIASAVYGSNNYASPIYSLLSLIFYFVGCIVLLIVQIKRLHDLNNSGWYVLLNVIPLASIILLIYYFFQPGTDGDNKYGIDPLTLYDDRI